MSESFKPLDPLCELDRLAFDLDFDLDGLDFDLNGRDLDLDPDRDPSSHEGQPHAKRKVRILPVGIRSLSNSPGCAPDASLVPGSTIAPTIPPTIAPTETLREGRPGRARAAESNSKAPASAQTPRTLKPIRRARAVRVDAWAVPASANWTRTQKTARKIRRVSRSTNWALPF